jgi:hypothetical protein
MNDDVTSFPTAEGLSSFVHAFFATCKYRQELNSLAAATTNNASTFSAGM